MISISSFWSSIEIPGRHGIGIKEREPESMPMLMARVEFSGPHFLPINHIPGRIFGMEEDQFRILRGEISNVTFVGTDMAVFAKGEEREDPKEGLRLVIDIPFLEFGFPQNIFLDVDKLKRDLVRHAKACGTPLSPDQIEKLATLKKSVQELEGRFT